MSDAPLPRRRRLLRWVVGGAAALLLFAVAWVVIRGIGAVNELQQASDGVATVKSAISDGDVDKARQAAEGLGDHAAASASLTSDPIWRGFEVVPWLGANFTAVREVAAIADNVASDALDPLLDAATDLDLNALGVSAGRVDLAPFAAVAEPLGGASAMLADADARAKAINTDSTLSPLADAVAQMRAAVSEANTVIGALHGASMLMPSMLGADGPRTYVVAMQNNAEARSAGGIVGALALVTADQGQIRIVRNASSSDFPPLDKPLALSDPVVALFEEQPGRHLQNLTSIPQFPEAAQAISTRWTDRFGDAIDGVVAVDAVVARNLVAASGPVQFGPFTATGDDVLDILLSRIYAEIPDPEVQDAVFAQASAALLGTALSGGDPRALLSAISTSSDEGRIRIWSAHEEEQSRLATSTLSGLLPQDDDADAGGTTWVGALFNDTTGAKMDFYANADITVATGECQGEPTTQVRVTWRNDAPADAETSLPAYVTGNGIFGVRAGSTRTLVAVYGPQGAIPSRIDRGGGANDDQGSTDDHPIQTAVIDGRTVVQHSVVLAPGESTTITVDYTGEGSGTQATSVIPIPLLHSNVTTRGELRCVS